MATRGDGVYDPEAPTWAKITNRQYSHAVGRHERFRADAGCPAAYFAKPGIVLNADVGLNRRPSTLSWPADGARNSTVPRFWAVSA